MATQAVAEEIARHLPRLATKRSLDRALLFAALQVMPIGWKPAADYEDQRAQAERRIAARDPDDWPTVALRSSSTCPSGRRTRILPMPASRSSRPAICSMHYKPLTEYSPYGAATGTYVLPAPDPRARPCLLGLTNHYESSSVPSTWIVLNRVCGAPAPAGRPMGSRCTRDLRSIESPSGGPTALDAVVTRRLPSESRSPDSTQVDQSRSPWIGLVPGVRSVSSSTRSLPT